MSAETQFYSALTGAAGVTAIVGSGSAARIYPDLTPQEIALPCVAYSRTGTEYLTTIHSGVPLGADVTIECWCMATTRTAADALADAVEAAAGAVYFTPASRSSVVPDPEQLVIATVLTSTKYV